MDNKLISAEGSAFSFWLKKTLQMYLHSTFIKIESDKDTLTFNNHHGNKQKRPQIHPPHTVSRAEK